MHTIIKSFVSISEAIVLSKYEQHVNICSMVIDSTIRVVFHK